MLEHPTKVDLNFFESKKEKVELEEKVISRQMHNMQIKLGILKALFQFQQLT